MQTVAIMLPYASLRALPRSTQAVADGIAASYIDQEVWEGIVAREPSNQDGVEDMRSPESSEDGS